ncbi:MAG TPA: FG-GAP-like repeat-containing protein [Blastocatellia bacterium]|nr:FG-GAP-like repeat-containing protein [Blastocatellia bacterium]
MKPKYLIALLCVVVITTFVVTGHLRTVRGAQTGKPDPRIEREVLYRFNNIGVAYLEQYKHEEAAKEFKQALARDPNFAIGQINLAIASYFLRDIPTAAAAARAAIRLMPESPHAHYILGLILRGEKQYDEAVAEFNKVLAIDPKDAYANLQIGQIYMQNRQFDQAVKVLSQALESEPYNKTAAYNLATAYNRAGRTAEGQKYLTLFQQLQNSGYATSLGPTYGEQGRYAEGVVSTGAEAELVSKEPSAVKFVDATAAMNLKVSFGNKPLASVLGRKVTKAEFENEATKRELVNPFSATIGLPDYDGDNKLDIFAAGIDADGKPFAKLLHNDGGKFSDVTEKTKITVNGPVSGAVFGDYDNDGKQDILIFGYNTLALWRNNGDGSFTDVTAKVGLPANYNSWAMTAAFVDVDHDGDLDIFIGNFADLTKWPGGDAATFPDDFAGTPNKLLRNNGIKDGNVTFTDITDKAGLSGGANKTTAVVCTDFDNHRDIDFLVVNYNAPVQLFANQRDGSFKEVARQVQINDSGKSLSVAAGDFNKDGFTDFFIAHIGTPDEFYLSQGQAVFNSWIPGNFTTNGVAAQFVDYDNDGLLDVLLVTRDRLLEKHSLGRSGPRDSYLWSVSGSNTISNIFRSDLKTADLRAFSSGDLDANGTVDLLTINDKGSLIVLRNEGASKNYVAVNLAGKSSNRSGVGTKAEIRSGSLSQKLELYASSPAPAPASLVFGLGYRTQVDALKLLWPAGIVQSELTVKTSAPENIEELDRKGTSCPLLYAWNGSEYAFVTDFLGGCAIGAREPGNTWSIPDTDEYVRVTGEQLRPRDGVYSLRMNNQLEEVIFFDAVKLLAVDHPAETDIYPNEKLMPGPPYTPFKIWSVRSPKPPASAVDDKGRDILPLVAQIDRRYPEDFEKLPFKGYAKEHTIELDLGKEALRAKQTVLLLHAWIDYADSTASLAASQAGVEIIPPYLQVKNASGEWQTVIDSTGFPAGLPKTMTVDLTGKFLCDDARVRIVTSMRIYWDQILVDASDGDAPVKVTTLEPMRADLRWRGFPREYSPDGRLPLIYDYRTIEPTAPWKAHLGNYTRFGDVRELLLAPEDRYVVTRNGDELQVDFDARKLPPLSKGWKRDFLVYADGFGKDMDLNSARPETIGELPFHGMKSYPPAPGESYPNNPQHQEYLRKYNTRTVSRQMEAQWRGVK